MLKELELHYKNLYRGSFSVDIYFKLTSNNELLFINENNKFMIDNQSVYSLMKSVLHLENNIWYAMDILYHQQHRSLLTLHDKIYEMFRGKHQDPPSAVSIFISDQFDIPADHLFDAKNLFKSGSAENTEMVLCTNSEYEALLEINAHALYIVSGARGMYLLNRDR